PYGDRGAAEAGRGQLAFDFGLQGIELHIPGRTHGDFGAGSALAHPIFDDGAVPTGYRPAQERMHDHDAEERDDILRSSLDVDDAAHLRSAHAWVVEQRHFICQLVADERLNGVVEIRDVHLGGASSGCNRTTIAVHGLEDGYVLAQVHSSTLPARG